MKQARDLFLLATIAYQQGKHSDAGTLFATAMASSDVNEFLDLLNEENTVTAGTMLATSKSIETTLSQAVNRFSASLSEEAEDEELTSLPKLSDAGTEGEDDTELDEDDEDFNDDIDTDNPGCKVLPSSLSSTVKVLPLANTKPSTRIIISSTLKSPVKVKA
jgi:hypothetical protein